ncbi:peptidyl-prolyl cis-trans isomerase-like 1 isoform X1 [Hydra vulgaris]|nr:peptidyl-prolyl cis-trans isomerase-like 1 [Hydra vulgaris]
MAIPSETWCPPKVELNTSMGDIEVELYWKHAPRTCRNFAELTRRGYYDKTKFHRVIPNFMIQTGDPTGTGKGGSSIYGPMFEDEIHPELKHTGAGVLSMANSGPHSNGSQYFITLAPCQWLDGKHSIFGRVCRGMEVIKKIGMVQTDPTSDRPTEDVYIIEAHCSRV